MLSLKTDVNVPTVRNKQKKLEKLIFVGILKATTKKRRIRILSRIFVCFLKTTVRKMRIRIRLCNPMYGSRDPDWIRIKMSWFRTTAYNGTIVRGRPVLYSSLWFSHVAAMHERLCWTQRWTAWAGGTDTTRPPQPSIFTLSPIGFSLYTFLLMSPVVYFSEMSGFEPRKLP